MPTPPIVGQGQKEEETMKTTIEAQRENSREPAEIKPAAPSFKPEQTLYC